MTIKSLQSGRSLHLLAYGKLLAYQPQGSIFFNRCPVLLTPKLQRELNERIKTLEAIATKGNRLQIVLENVMVGSGVLMICTGLSFLVNSLGVVQAIDKISFRFAHFVVPLIQGALQ